MNVFGGRACARLMIWILPSAPQLAKISSVSQSTSKQQSIATSEYRTKLIVMTLTFMTFELLVQLLFVDIPDTYRAIQTSGQEPSTRFGEPCSEYGSLLTAQRITSV